MLVVQDTPGIYRVIQTYLGPMFIERVLKSYEQAGVLWEKLEMQPDMEHGILWSVPLQSYGMDHYCKELRLTLTIGEAGAIPRTVIKDAAGRISILACDMFYSVVDKVVRIVQGGPNVNPIQTPGREGDDSGRGSVDPSTNR